MMWGKGKAAREPPSGGPAAAGCRQLATRWAAPGGVRTWPRSTASPAPWVSPRILTQWKGLVSQSPNSPTENGAYEIFFGWLPQGTEIKNLQPQTINRRHFRFKLNRKHHLEGTSRQPLGPGCFGFGGLI